MTLPLARFWRVDLGMVGRWWCHRATARSNNLQDPDQRSRCDGQATRNRGSHKITAVAPTGQAATGHLIRIHRKQSSQGNQWFTNHNIKTPSRIKRLWVIMKFKRYSKWHYPTKTRKYFCHLRPFQSPTTNGRRRRRMR